MSTGKGFTVIAFDEARQRLLDGVTPMDRVETVAVRSALGRVLAAPVIAACNVPNHANSAMDGYAIRTMDLFPDRPTPLRVTRDLPAGARLTTPLEPGEAVRIMTGAPIPEGCDCVVMQEVVTRDGASVVIPANQKPGENIRLAGEDIRQGTEVLAKGRRIMPAEMGVLTSVGHGVVEVMGRLKVAILSTGDELVTPGEALQPGQVYDSNRSTLLGALTALGVEVLDLGLAQDNRETIANALRRGADEADALITSGGVSVGDFDLVKDVINSLGEIHFWQVNMKPGKPQAYGRLGKAAFFGLPGNPVSSLAVFLVMVKPALLKMMGALPEPPRRFKVPVRGRIGKKHDRLEFQRAILHFEEQGPWVESVGAQGSGILTSFIRSNCLVVLPVGPCVLNEGDLADVWLYDYV